MDNHKIKNFEDLKLAKNKAFSKDSEIYKLQQQLKQAPKEKKPLIGREITLLKEKYEKFFNEVEDKLKRDLINKKVSEEYVDITEPVLKGGSLHPLTLIENKFREWFVQNSYYETEYGEIISDLYNFERLNIPKNHPARETHDSLFLTPKTLLKTHNTGISAMELEKNKNKSFSNFVIGKVYRNDKDDATHSHQFTQVDFVAVGIYTFSNLIWTLKSLLSYVFEQELEIRLRPSFFPFTEPSVEVDIFYKNRWIEILGAGMLHPNVLKMAGYTNGFNGFAAGIGIERVTMIKYGINDIRELYKNDLRILEFFKHER